MATRLGQHAVVIGGSLAGVMTARVLADHFDRVTILERDQIDDHPAVRKSIPQGNHLHALLLGGQQVMSSLFPNFTDRMDQLGAVRYRAGIEGAFWMSSAALQVEELQRQLTERAAGNHGLEGLALAFFAEAAEVVATPWTLAANADFAYPQTRGDRPPDARESSQYFGALFGLMADDMDVYKLVVEVFQLARPISALREEPLRGRVEARLRK